MGRKLWFFTLMTTVSFAGIALIFFVFVRNWEIIPDFLPVRIWIAGGPRIYLGKWFLFLLPIGSVIVYLIFSIMFLKPGSFQIYPYRMTSATREHHHAVIKGFALVLQVETVWMLAFFEFWTIDFILYRESLWIIPLICMIPAIVLSAFFILRGGRKVPR